MSGLRCWVMDTVADPWCLSRIQDLDFPSRIPDLGRIRNTELTKNLGILNPKNLFKALGNMIREFIPNFGSRIRIFSWCRGQKGTGSRIWNTDYGYHTRTTIYLRFIVRNFWGPQAWPETWWSGLAQIRNTVIQSHTCIVDAKWFILDSDSIFQSNADPPTDRTIKVGQVKKLLEMF